MKKLKEIKKNIGILLSNMFFCYGVVLFDSRFKKYGGFNHFLAYKVFRYKYDYVGITIAKQFKFDSIFEDEEYYYDGYHNIINIGFIQIYYGT